MKFALALAVPLAAATAAAGCIDDSGPRLERIEPAAAGRGAQVTLFGSRLCGQPADCARAAGTVQLGLSSNVVQARVVEYADARAVIAIPDVAPVGPTAIVVTVNERASNAIDFEVLP